ncbi:MAG: sigma-E factor negative regulatory protein [Proteobacteria bacterium]|nr:sigma-E factor negative regulatory protein [Pseudomonadota bacterium]
MKSKISAMMDGELPDAELAALMPSLRGEGEAVEAWRQYHLISDALRDTDILSSGFSARFAARLEQEPAIVAPASVPKRAEAKVHWLRYSATAAAAAVFVGWLAFQPRQEVVPAQTLAKAPEAMPVTVPVPKEADDYLRAHQNYSPRNNLQGVAPYVRTVSDTARSR